MNIKNLVSLLVAFVLILSVGSAFVACTDESADNENSNNTTTTTTSTTTSSTVNGENNPENPGTPEDTKPTYKITVVDQDGNPVEGAFVQLCNGDLCKMPVATDARKSA